MNTLTKTEIVEKKNITMMLWAKLGRNVQFKQDEPFTFTIRPDSFWDALSLQRLDAF